jgi:hypothetical protein
MVGVRTSIGAVPTLTEMGQALLIVGLSFGGVVAIAIGAAKRQVGTNA